MPEVNITNFSKGMIRDAALDQQKNFSLYTLENYYVRPSDGALVKRAGSDRFNIAGYPAEVKQIHFFSSTPTTTFQLTVSDDKLYKTPTAEIQIGGTTSHDFSAGNFPYPFAIAGNRVIFSDDNDWYWGDGTSLGNNTTYQVGIDKSTLIPQVNGATSITQATQDSFVELTDTGTTDEVAQSFILPASLGDYSSYFADGIQVWLRRDGGSNIEGYIRIVAVNDSSSDPGSTDTDKVDTNSSFSNWINVQDIGTGGALVLLPFQDVIRFDAGATYWYRIQTENRYKATFVTGTRRIIVGIDTGAGYGDGAVKTYNGSTWSASTAYDTTFQVGSAFLASDEHKYRFGHKNDATGAESIASDEISVDRNGIKLTDLTFPSNSQVDRITIYRTDDPAIDAELRLLGEVDSPHPINTDQDTDTVVDMVDDSFRANLFLQTDDHTRLRDSNLVEVTPQRIALYKSRLWCSVSGEDNIYFSKRVEFEGPLGLPGKPFIDVFPVNNTFPTETNKPIEQLLPISLSADIEHDERLIIYFSDSIGMISSADGVQNPPDALTFEMVTYGTGLVGPNAVANIKGRHVFMSRDGLYAFNGTPTLEHLSKGWIQSIFDSISDTNLAKTIIRHHDRGAWIAIDEDDDGTIDSFYLLELDAPLTYWRVYKYNFGIHDFAIQSFGGALNRILVAGDISDFYLRELETGTSDTDVDGNAVAIDGVISTHFMRSSNGGILTPQAHSPFLTITPYYPSIVPATTYTVYDKDGNSQALTITPPDARNKRGHRKGFRVSSDEIRAEVKQSSIYQDEIRELNFKWR